MKTVLKLFLLCCVFVIIYTLDCRDEENNKVDWFFVYKIPQINHNDSKITNGTAYAYITSSNVNWKYSNNSINNSNSIIGNTLSFLYGNQTNTAYLLYNDQPPNSKPAILKGQTKGLIAADGYGGFWLIHSVPKFPQLKKYIYPTSGRKYAHMFFCASMNLPYINEIGDQLTFNQPNIYKKIIPKYLLSRLPKIKRASTNKKKSETIPSVHALHLLSKKNVKILSFGRSKYFRREIYLDLIAPYLGTPLLVQSWGNVTKNLKSDCTREFHINNIKFIKMTEPNVKFSSKEDKSIWAISSRIKFPWICIADMFKSHVKRLRGGGVVCIYNKKLNEQFKKLIFSIEGCNKL